MLLTPGLRARFALLLCRSFSRALTLRPLAASLSSAIAKAIPPASSPAATSTPAARPFTLGLLLRSSLSAPLFGFAGFLIFSLDRRHNLLCFNGLLGFRAAAFNHRRTIARPRNYFADEIGVFVFFHQEVGNVEDRKSI